MMLELNDVDGDVVLINWNQVITVLPMTSGEGCAIRLREMDVPIEVVESPAEVKEAYLAAVKEAATASAEAAAVVSRAMAAEMRAEFRDEIG